MTMINETIAAISTPRGKGGISVIRVSGPQAVFVVQNICKTRKPLSEHPSRQSLFTVVMDQERLVDEVLVTIFRAPHSYTGEDVVEISCHGNEFITTQILELLLSQCRMANPGEFTFRAFLNQKMDLTRAEAVGNLLMAQTLQSQKAALMQMEGKLENRIRRILSKLTDLRIKFELAIDFIEDEIPLFEENDLMTALMDIENELIALEKSGHDGLIVNEGLKISLAGAPNVGKSSLFNRFLESERAIVTPIPGTTRDYLEEAIAIEGYLVRFFDTAGIRDAVDQVEQIGINRSWEIIKDSDYVLYLSSSEQSDDMNELFLSQLPEDKVIRVYNKCENLTDTELNKLEKEGWIPCSAITPGGLDGLKQHLLSLFGNVDSEMEAGMISNARQLSAVRKSLKSLLQAKQAMNQSLGVEFIAFDLKECSVALEEIIGKVSSDDMLNSIFDRFCIGK